MTRIIMEKTAFGDEDGNNPLQYALRQIVEQAHVLEEATPLINDPTAVLGPELDEEDEVKEESSWEKDQDHSKFLHYLRTRLENLPRHTGKTTVGCERVIAVLKRLDSELTRAIQSDENNQIDEVEAERLRDMMHGYIVRLREHCDKLMDSKTKKKADIRVGKTVITRIADGGVPEYYISVADQSGEMLLPVEIVEPSDQQVQAFSQYSSKGLTKEAFHAKIHLIADPFLHEITRLIIEGHVSHGRNVDKIYQKLDSRYKFTDRDHLAIQSLLREKGLFLNKDLSRLGEDVYLWEGGAESDKTYPA